MKQKVIRTVIRTLLIVGVVLALQSVVSAMAGNIDPSNNYAWGTNVGWLNFNSGDGDGVTVYPDHLEGDVWAENVGWIRLGTYEGGGAHTYANLSNTDYGVNQDVSGNLSGYAWGTNVGWINFNPTNGGVTIDPATGSFDGYAWGESIGWIHFKNTGANPYNVVVTQMSSPLQTLIDDASSGDTITLDANTTYAGGANANKPLTIDLNGATVGHGSPAFTITASDVTILNGVLDGTGDPDSSPAVLVQSGGDNFALQAVEVTNWVNGIEISADVTSLKVVGNYFHGNEYAGLQINSSVVLSGVVAVEGNLFKNNGGNGIQNDGTTALNAEYNSWGNIGGAAAGDGVSANVNASNPTFAELFVAVNPGTEDESRTVVETEQFTVTLEVDAANLYGVQYHLSYSETILTLDGTTDGDFRGTGQCTTQTGTPGEVTVFCTRLEPDSNADGTPLTISELTFTPISAGLTGDGPWTQDFDLSTSPSQLLSGARGGVTTYVNNGGFGAPSLAGLRTITDAQDGEIVINPATGNYTGFINLEGRLSDESATVRLYNQPAMAGATELANGTSVSDGSYTSAHLAGQLLRLNQTYYLQVDAPLYLPTTATSEVNYAHSAQLTTVPLTSLETLVLLGGDASNNDVIDLADATCIGTDFGTTTSTCVVNSGASSDVTGDGQIDLVDLVLMGGNYARTSSPWTP